MTIGEFEGFDVTDRMCAREQKRTFSLDFCQVRAADLGL
jgi:hypothetical protein